LPKKIARTLPLYHHHHHDDDDDDDDHHHRLLFGMSACRTCCFHLHPRNRGIRFLPYTLITPNQAARRYGLDDAAFCPVPSPAIKDASSITFQTRSILYTLKWN
jgi:hypothetical protein